MVSVFVYRVLCLAHINQVKRNKKNLETMGRTVQRLAQDLERVPHGPSFALRDSSTIRGNTRFSHRSRTRTPYRAGKEIRRCGAALCLFGWLVVLFVWLFVCLICGLENAVLYDGETLDSILYIVDG